MLTYFARIHSVSTRFDTVKSRIITVLETILKSNERSNGSRVHTGWRGSAADRLCHPLLSLPW
ncbi:hypothetical protein EON65_03690 [archaeon]|nr:MAG: hypothetical protein EON65_03690 [archaeon]